MLELERTYLAKRLPKDLRRCRCKEIVDSYIPQCSEHPMLRLRKSENNYELTKKEPIQNSDASEQQEQTIILTEFEFNSLQEQIKGKRVHKIKYYYDYGGRTAEFDVFQDALQGLVVVEFEFATIEEKNSFEIPDFCLADITQELFIAGGRICGKSYEDIERELKRFKYSKLFLE